MVHNIESAAVDHLALMNEIGGLATQFDVFRFLKKVAELFCERAFIVFRIPGATTQELQSVSVITNWPAELLSKYDASGLLQSSPVIKKIKQSSVPFRYDTNDVDVSIQDRSFGTVTELFNHYNMPRGAYFPVADPGGDRGAIGFSGDREPFTDYELMQLLMICTSVFDRLYQISRKDMRAGDELTEREIDCLNWTAAGKTSAEISEILGLSEHTVNHYLNRATKKLDTVNRTQAVAKALRTGIIS
ncbi:LuxR family transcriptional regulator [Rhizobium alvei]|uniref:LuxR family transcriptional regulator n=1 Tax=Rhizobium alvei TaxID=1132659 RepID=A0ABT8YG29_9HYPH|nr:LuxR family transcriptional regulator [Rhizobium alvei]MDO6962627.1 LuxR family transcriptional regulator [Rhizobium alvei]